MPARNCQTPVATKTIPFQKWAEKRSCFTVGSASDVTFAACRSTTSQQGGTSPGCEIHPKDAVQRGPPPQVATSPTICGFPATSAGSPKSRKDNRFTAPTGRVHIFRSRSGGNPPDDGRCARDLLKRGCKTKACFFRKVVPSGDFFVRIGQETFC